MARKNAKPRLPAWSLPLLSLVVALVLHAVWSLPRLKLPEAAANPIPLKLTMRQVRGNDAWRPVLFSLPSPDGFSGVVRRLDTRLSPPLETPVNLTRSSPFRPLEGTESARLPDFPLQDEAVSLLTPLRPEPAMDPGVRSGWTLRFSGRPDLRSVLARDHRVPNPQSAVRLEGEMIFDTYGRLQSVLFDPHKRSEREMELLLPDVRQVTLPARAAGGRYRFELEFRPPAP